MLPAFPFGSDFTEVEQRLIPALETLKDASASLLSVVPLAIAGLGADKAKFAAELARLGLDKPVSWSDRLYRLLVSGTLKGAG